MDFFKYIHAVGTGVKGNRDLSFEEAEDMMHQILTQKAPREQIAAFLLGWRLKPETTEEFRGAISACERYTKKTPIPHSLELGYPFDGKAKNPYLLPLIAKQLKANTLQLVVSSDEKQPAKDGITLKSIVEHLSLDEHLHYFDRKEYCKELHELTGLRNTLGLRTAFNTIEKLPHVAQSEYAITGVFHKPYLQKYVDIFGSRYKRFALIHGNEGTPELFSKGRLWIANTEGIEEFIIDPEYYGIHYKKSWERISFEDSLAQVQNPTDEFVKLARLNAAIYLFVANEVASIGEGYEQLS